MCHELHYYLVCATGGVLYESTDPGGAVVTMNDRDDSVGIAIHADAGYCRTETARLENFARAFARAPGPKLSPQEAQQLRMRGVPRST
jgi:hypothetical protein